MQTQSADGAARRRWDGDSRVHYPLITEVALSPDGHQVVYAVREPLLTEDRSAFVTHLHLAAREGGETIQLTFGEASDGGARWSPDGRFIAFRSNRSGTDNIWVMRATGGEAWALTRYDKGDVRLLAWSPDGSRIAFLMADPPGEDEERAQRAQDDAVEWGEDFTFAHLHVVPFAVTPRSVPTPSRLTRGRFNVEAFDWLPDGTALAILHQSTPTHNSWSEARLAIVGADGGEPRDLGAVANRNLMGGPRASPDGQWIACHKEDEPVRFGLSGRLALFPSGGGAPRLLAATPDAHTELIGWSPDGNDLYALDWRGIATQLFAVPISGAEPRPLTDPALLKLSPAANRGGQIAFIGQSFHEPNAVYVLDVTGDAPELERVARPPLPSDWPDAPLPRAEIIRWPAPDGREIEGILIYPLDATVPRPCPLIVEIHGGPTSAHLNRYLADPAGYADLPTLAERGYAILRPNPRGSRGYGRDFRFANYGDWGGGDFQDILAGVAHLVAAGIADPDRLGILGWSYGGYLTSWAITQTDRFKVACVGAGITDPVSFNGTTDIPSFIPDYFGAEFWEDPEAYRRQSPIAHVARVQTPTLIQHGEQDPRVPLGQGKELYNALARRGVPVALAIYPRQGHVVTEPRLLLDMKRRATAWLDRWLGDQSPDTHGTIGRRSRE